MNASLRNRVLVATGALILAIGLGSGRAEGAASADQAAAAPAPAVAPQPPPTVTDALSQILDSAARQRAALVLLHQAGSWRRVAERLTALEEVYRRLDAGTADSSGLVALVEVENRLAVLYREVDLAGEELTAIAQRLERDGNGLEEEALSWQKRLAFMEQRAVPAAVSAQAAATLEAVQRIGMRLRRERDEVLVALGGFLALQVRSQNLLTRLASRQEQARERRLQQEEAPIWRLGSSDPGHADIVEELGAGYRVVRDYMAQHEKSLAWLFLGTLLPAWWLLARRSRDGAGSGRQAYGPPMAAALLIALMALFGLAPNAPLYFYELLFAILPVPAALVARRTFAAPVPLLLAGVTLAAILFPLRNAIDSSAVVDRLLLLLQVMSLAVPLIIEWRRGNLQKALHRLSPRVVRAIALLILAGSALITFHVVFGFTGPTRSLRSGVGTVLGFSLIFGAAAVAAYGLVLALLATPALHWLRSARQPDPALLRAVRVVLVLLAVSGVLVVTLGSFGLVLTMFAAVDSVMGATFELGTLSYSVGAVVTALGVVVATVVFATVTEFVLNREIVPRLRMSAGAGYALATLTRWAIVIVGVALTFDALNIDLMKVTLLAGALGVGIGFGLQTIVNNFVSGLILIVERPVAVGDMVEIGPLLGDVKRIGIRSSTVRTTQGAEVIVPNSDLASKQVVNWTRSDRQRRYEIDVGVAYGSDPDVVMRLLVEAAKEVPEIMAAPPPMATFDGFGDSSLNFRLLAWVTTVDVGLQARTGLRVAILRKLNEAGIEIPFPQRDLHIRTSASGAPPVPA